MNGTPLQVEIGKSPSVVSRILAAESNITLKTIAEFAEALKGDILIAASTKAPLPATDGGAYIVAYVPHNTAVSVFQRAADSRRAFQDVVADCLTEEPVKLPSRLISELRSLEDPAGIEAVVTDAIPSPVGEWTRLRSNLLIQPVELESEGKYRLEVQLSTNDRWKKVASIPLDLQEAKPVGQQRT